MKRDWIKIIPQITNNMSSMNPIKCPNCGKHGIDYIYIGDEETRVGFLQVWCSICLKGIHISRAVAPVNAKFVPFDTDLKDLIPKYDFVDD